MSNFKDIKKITESLNKNPMFRLSLGSKELFHSNFLEFLWEQNSDSFLEMLKEITQREEDKMRIDVFIAESKFQGYKLELAREKEHFDICIFHMEGKDIIYDIIIENKVKSIPYMAQLVKYSNIIETKQCEKSTDCHSPIYILLSLPKTFANRDEISKSWIIVDYASLYDYLYNHVSQFANGDECLSLYIKDYSRFIYDLDSLENTIKEEGRQYPNSESQIYKCLRDIRLHDLFLKLKGSFFIGELYNRIANEKIDPNEIIFGQEDKTDKKHTLFLSSSYHNGKSTITTTVRHNQIFYAIQIEGDQYRHMIIKDALAKNSCHVDSRKIDSNLVEGSLDASLALNFLKFENKFVALGLSSEINKKYCRYGDDVVYRYKKFTDRVDMLDIMAQDVIDTYQVLNNCAKDK